MSVRWTRFNLYLVSAGAPGCLAAANSATRPIASRARRRSSVALLIFFWVCLALGVSTGCKTTPETKQERQLARFELHQETNPDTMGRTESVAVYREQPVNFTVNKEPFLTEGSVKEAKVVDTLGGFALRIEFDKEGSMLLEQYSSGSLGRHFAVFGQWDDTPESHLNKGRWLAAPRIQKHITDGVFIFTPDATREEAESIALGLNNLARKLETGKELKW